MCLLKIFLTLYWFTLLGAHSPSALDRLDERWEQVQQSDTNIRLNAGALNVTFTFTLPNYNPPAGHHGHRVGVMSKKTMYVRTIYDEWYTKTDALKRTPFTSEELCWPMAFLGCQVRSLSLGEDKKSIVGVTESVAKKSYANVEVSPTSTYRYVPCDNVEVAQSIKKHMPHLVQRVGNQWQLVVFNPYKKPKDRVDNVYEYYLDDAGTVGELNAWIAAATCIILVSVEKHMPRCSVSISISYV